MGTRYLPRVTAKDHEAFRNLVHAYPAGSYDKWLQFQAKEIADWEASGGKVVLIDVSTDEFTRYCRDTGARHDIHTFRGVSAAKGIGKFK